MSTKKAVQYIDTDVYTEAKRRINHVLDTFDTVLVCCSGGKDSLVTLYLVEEVYRERGITDKIKVIFRDEELIPDAVINFVQDMYHSGKYEFYYYACQLKSSKFILGKTYDYIQWDENRDWIRPKPDFAITDPKNRVFSQYTMDEFIAKGHKGKVAFFTGIRTDESMFRFRSIVNKKNECYISASSSPNVKLCKPIYDWSEKDIFKYFYDNNIQYCPIYDAQVWNNQALRVATPMLAESAKFFHKQHTLYPTFYQQVVNIFPEMLLQERYWHEYDRDSVFERYPHSWEGVIKYIKEEIDGDYQRKLAIKRVLDAKKIRENNMSKGRSKNLGGYPILYVFKCVVNGGYKRVIQPQKKLTKKDLEFEGLTG